MGRLATSVGLATWLARSMRKADTGRDLTIRTSGGDHLCLTDHAETAT